MSFLLHFILQRGREEKLENITKNIRRIIYFSLRSLTKDFIEETIIRLSLYNPRTHVGCDPAYRELSVYQRISIHAPMWGATMTPTTGQPMVQISIHAPMWGATILLNQKKNRGVPPPTAASCFKGRWKASISYLNYNSNNHYYQISIHAPMWGATVEQNLLKKVTQISIHAPMWGATWL